MSLQNADQLSSGETLRTDICIVGAGAAGIAMALALEKSRYRVLLVESGDVGGSKQADGLNDLELSGHPFNVDAAVRRRGLGGTTLATYGRCVRLDDVDFEHRPWVSDQDWPIDPRAIEPFYEQAASVLELDYPELLDPEQWSEHSLAQLAKAHDLSVRVHRWGREPNLGKAWQKSLEQSTSINVLLRGTATGIEAGPGGDVVQSLKCQSLSGTSFSVQARQFVLACGGLETPRLLLLATRTPNPPAINWNPVGRFYMNHPRAEGVAHVEISPGVRPANLRPFVLHRNRGKLQFAFSPDEQLQKKEKLLNHSSFFYAVSDEKAEAARRQLDRVSGAARTDRNRLVRESLKLSRHLPVLAGGILPRIRLEPYRARRLVVVDQCEQIALASSRLDLGGQLDAMGLPKGRLDWRIGSETTDSLRRLHGLMQTFIEASGIGRFQSRLLEEPDFVPDYMDCAHPTGTTRMSENPELGVVDRNCQVHGVKNLHIAGSSVFPVVGQANPTFAIIALALRLADRLSKQ